MLVVDYSKNLLFSRLVDILYLSTPLATAGNLFVGGYVSLYYWDHIDSSFVLVWLSTLLVINLVRLVLHYQFKQCRGHLEHFTTLHWLLFFALGTGLSAACWGGGLVFLLLTLPFSQVALFYISVLALMSISLGMTSAAWKVFAVYAGLSVLPAALVCLALPDLGIMGLLTLAYYVVSLFVSLKAHKVLKQSIIHQLANDRLMMALQHEKDQVLKLNAQLQKDLKAGKRAAETLLAQKHQAEELADKMYELSAIDSLTGIANRRVFDDVLAQEWARARRLQLPLSLIVADIDHFKLLNDHYGHHYGDECLQSVALILKDHLKRPSDLLARYGGEEFVIILPSTGLVAAEMLAQKMRAGIEAASLQHECSPVSDVVTISLGVASMVPVDNRSGYALFEAADKALYDAKKSGRNRTVACEDFSLKS